jgi:DNA polymerase III subunit epsilon
MKKRADLSQASFEFEPELMAGKPFVFARPLVFFDLETTGLDPKIDRIVQFAFIRVQGEERSEWTELVNPDIPIPPESTRIHRITDAMVRDMPTFSQFATRIQAFIHGCDLAGFNIAGFDLKVLTIELERCGIRIDWSQHNIIDAQIIFHRREPRDLGAAYRFYCQRDLAGAHDALVDVRATVEVLQGQLARYADLPHDAAGLAKYCNVVRDDRWVTADRKFYWRHHQAFMAFGKHKGQSLKWVHENYPDYLVWLRDTDLPEETQRVIDAALKGQYPRREAENGDQEGEQGRNESPVLGWDEIQTTKPDHK